MTKQFLQLTYWTMSEQIAAEAVKTPTVEELQASLIKAEAKIVDLKKNSTQTESKEETVAPTEDKVDDVTTYSQEDVDALLAKAQKENAIVSQETQFKENQTQTNSQSISGEAPAPTGSSFEKISLRDYDALPQSQKNSYYKSCVEKTGELDFA